MIRLISDWSEIERELDRVESLPDFKTNVKLNGVLREGYLITQADVHIESGDLKGSGKAKSEEKGKTWTGELKYGGVSSGGDVDYAIYEKRRGGDHDFMRDLTLLHPMWVESIRESLAGK